MTATEAEFDAKERRIDDLVEQAAKLVADLNSTVADMKRILEAASANVEAQQEISARGRKRG
jgi:ABC-type transporter Mla subunit MlaD